jgi:2-oxoisovalerate ferredoxin oxidoreductase alpha subunit
MAEARLATGNEAVAWAVARAGAQVIAAYPITPQTTIIEHLASLVGKGVCKAEYVPVESEHSALAACIGAAHAGARAFTATSGQGLALMHELVHWSAGARLPIVLVNVNRAMAPRGRSGPTRTTRSRSATPGGSSSTARTRRSSSTR